MSNTHLSSNSWHIIYEHVTAICQRRITRKSLKFWADPINQNWLKYVWEIKHMLISLLMCIVSISYVSWTTEIKSFNEDNLWLLWQTKAVWSMVMFISIEINAFYLLSAWPENLNSKISGPLNNTFHTWSRDNEFK